ncbi:MAG TPA: energy transducer TonB [Polyangia bacterium]|nr:energy transducer TonB [Polyangia bacterium]
MHARTSHRALALRIKAWATALAAASAAHALILAVALLAGRARGASIPAASADLLAHLGLALDEPATEEAVVDLSALELDRPLESLPSPEPSHEDLAGALPSDQTRALPDVAKSPRLGAPDRQPPAPDTGKGPGASLADAAWRADSSTLHERLTDGAERYQPAHTRTARRASSPQAVRRQPVVGIEDAARATRVAFAPRPAAVNVADPTDVGRGGETVAGAPSAAQAQAASGTRNVVAANVVSAGPLDAERGSTSYDVDDPGMARDRRSVRAASSELRPSIMDLSRAASPGEGASGNGPGEAPGATPRPTAGAAPALAGQAGSTDGQDEATRTRERAYARYEQELRARVNQYLGQVWPRALAVRLLQGEAMVSLVVQPDGRLAGPARVMKSAGFVEFDRAALEAIRLASPFPPLPRPGGLAPSARPFSVRVIFANPVIR